MNFSIKRIYFIAISLPLFLFTSCTDDDDNGNVIGVVVSGFSDMQNVNFGIKASVVKNLLVSNKVYPIKPKENKTDWRKFSQDVGEGTVLLSCWMTKKELAHLKKNNDKNKMLVDH